MNRTLVRRVTLSALLGVSLLSAFAAAPAGASTSPTPTQVSPTAGATTTPASYAFTDQLAATGGTAPYTFVATGGSSSLVVSPSGAVTTQGTLAPGSYTFSGMITDSVFATGTWSYTLTVTTGTITQGSPTSGTTSSTNSGAFTDQLTASNDAGVTLTYVTTSSSPSFTVSSAGAVQGVSSASPGTSGASGTVSDAYGDTGTWSYSLSVTAPPVTLTQSAPTSGTTTTTNSGTFTDQLVVTGGTGPYSFTTTTSAAGVNVSSLGAISTTGPLAANYYSVSGTVADSLGNTGSWSYTLTVTTPPVTLTQAAPTSGTATTTASGTFTAQMSMTGGSGSYTFTTSASSTGLNVSSSGAVSTAAALATGTYSASGTVVDSLGNTGTWSYSLSVTAVTLTQAAPTSGASTTTNSSSFTAQLAMTGGVGPYTFTFSIGAANPLLSVSTSGAVSTTGPLTSGTYQLGGTVTDSLGDSGTWSYTLTVATPILTQSSATTGSTTPLASATYNAQLSMAGATGAVTYTLNPTSVPLTVSSGGLITTTSTLTAPNTYTVSGTATDASGVTGTWAFTLSVVPGTLTQTSSTSAQVTTTAAPTYQTYITVSGATGPLSYTINSTSDPVTFTSVDVLTVTGPLSAGVHAWSGHVSDSSGNTGTWTFTLTVNAVTLTQSGATSVSLVQGQTFSTTLTASGGTGALTFSTAPPPPITVSSAGVISAGSTATAGTYALSGLVTDAYGDQGTWNFTITVVTPSLTQSGSSAGSASAPYSNTYSAQLAVSGSSGALTFTTTSAPSRYLLVSSGGLVTTSGYVPVGTYTVSGTVTDTASHVGLWTFTLTITAETLTTISSGSDVTFQGTPEQFTQSAPGGVGTVTYTITYPASLPAGLSVAADGTITATAALAVGTYNLTGNTTDSLGDTGFWSFTLVILDRPVSFVPTPVYSVAYIFQNDPISATVPANQSSGYTTQLSVSDSTFSAIGPSLGTPVFTFVTTSSCSPQSATSCAATASANFRHARISGGSLTVSSSGLVTTTGTLAPGTWGVSGTVTDQTGNYGTWQFTLTVVANPLTQTGPTSGTYSTVRQADSTAQLQMSGASGQVTYTVTGASPSGLAVSSTGIVTISAAVAAGTYSLSGTATDAAGDTGPWTFAVTVAAPVSATAYLASPGPGAIPTHGNLNAGAHYVVHVSTSGAVTTGFTSHTPGVCTVDASGVVTTISRGACRLQAVVSPSGASTLAPKTIDLAYHVVPDHHSLSITVPSPFSKDLSGVVVLARARGLHQLTVRYVYARGRNTAAVKNEVVSELRLAGLSLSSSGLSSGAHGIRVTWEFTQGQPLAESVVLTFSR